MLNSLDKHRKEADESFKKFVFTLEGLPVEKRQNILQKSFLEDPVYTAAIINNIVNFPYFLSLSKDDWDFVFENCKNNIKIFILAFHGTDYEQRVLDILGNADLRTWKDEVELIEEVDPGKRSIARNTIFTTMRKLQNQRVIAAYPWQLPIDEILTGKYYTVPKDGIFEIKYEDGTPALVGNVEKRLRKGPFQIFYPNGQVYAEGIYLNDEKVAEWKFYYMKGQVKAQGSYTEDMRQGEWIKFDPRGTPSKVIYERGKLV
jgi:hypothetical protein